VGFIASKKVGNAVKRNRAKRRMRALFSDFESSFASGIYIFVAKKSYCPGGFRKAEGCIPLFHETAQHHKKVTLVRQIKYSGQSYPGNGHLLFVFYSLRLFLRSQTNQSSIRTDNTINSSQQCPCSSRVIG
jgi:hypothetical protein